MTIGRDAEMRLQEDPRPRGAPPMCPRCRQAVDVRRYPNLSPPELWMDCWRCRISWNMSDEIE